MQALLFVLMSILSFAGAIPGDGDIVSSSPDFVFVPIDENVQDVQTQLSSALLQKEFSITLADASLVGDNQLRFEVPRELTDGKWQLSWDVVDANGLIYEGSSVFTVDAGNEVVLPIESDEPIADQEAADKQEELEKIQQATADLTTLFAAGVIVCVGALIVGWWLHRERKSSWIPGGTSSAANAARMERMISDEDEDF